MANALDTQVAPKKEKEIIKIEFGDTTEEVTKGSKEHNILVKEFDQTKKYMFELAVKIGTRLNPVIEVTGQKATVAPLKQFQSFRNIVLTSQIVWNGQRRMIRYYDGCTTIFSDKQPKNKELIDQLINQTSKEKYNFIEGKFGCYGYEKMLLLYLNICSWNAESEFRTSASNGVFKSINPDVESELESSIIDNTETALKLAKEASKMKMLIHADYLGIPTTDWDSGNELTEKEIRTAYRKRALEDSSKFIESYGNKSLETQYLINKALEKGIISNKFNANKATWGKNNTEICDISGLKSMDAIATKLFEFSQTEEGEEFLIQLKAVIQ